MRCLTLANALSERGVKIRFICRYLPRIFQCTLEGSGHEYTLLDEVPSALPAKTISFDHLLAHSEWLSVSQAHDAKDTIDALSERVWDWLIVDHYALDAHWEKALRASCKRLMVIDDLADRVHDCDLLLDQNLGRKAADYRSLLPVNATTLIGPYYSLLRPDFAHLRAESLAKRSSPQVKRLLITMGGVDNDNFTGLLLTVLNRCNLPNDLNITVILGHLAPWLQQVQVQATQMRCSTKVLVGVSDMARLLVESDLVIGAAGGSAWERCCLGVPSVVLVMAENQKAGAAALEDTGAALVVRSVSEFESLFQELLASGQLHALLESISLAASQVTDGLGAVLVTQHLAANYV